MGVRQLRIVLGGGLSAQNRRRWGLLSQEVVVVWLPNHKEMLIDFLYELIAPTKTFATLTVIKVVVVGPPTYKDLPFEFLSDKDFGLFGNVQNRRRGVFLYVDRRCWAAHLQGNLRR